MRGTADTIYIIFIASLLITPSEFYLLILFRSVFKMSIQIPVQLNPVITPAPLLLKDAKTLLTNPYLPMEAGYALNSEGMYHVAGGFMTSFYARSILQMSRFLFRDSLQTLSLFFDSLAVSSQIPFIAVCLTL